jgi:hypothetical protein
LNRDPIGEIAGANLHQANSNNLIDLYDLIGLFAEKNEPPPYNWDTGKKVHDWISRIVRTVYDGKPIGSGTDGVWELEFDRSLKVLGFGLSRKRPDIINVCYPELVWEIKPVTHLEQKRYHRIDDRQLNNYIREAEGKYFEKGDARIFFSFDTPLGYIYDKKGDEYKVDLISNHSRTGFIYYRLKRTGANKKEEMREELKEFLKKLLREGPLEPEDIGKWLPPIPGKIPVPN